MNQALARFEQYLKRCFGQSSTPKHYVADLYFFIQITGNKVPEAVTATDINAFVDRQIAADHRPTTINRRLSTIHTFKVSDNFVLYYPDRDSGL
jgi:site-specific recombinase XerD